MVLHFNILESPSPKDTLCQVWLKLARKLWRRFLNFVNVYSLIRNNLPLENGRVLHLNKIESLSPKDDLCQVWLKLAQWFWRRLLNFLLLFRNYLHLEKGEALQLNKLESTLPKDALCQVFFSKLVEWFRRRTFFIFINVFCYFVITSLWKRAWPFI